MPKALYCHPAKALCHPRRERIPHQQALTPSYTSLTCCVAGSMVITARTPVYIVIGGESTQSRQHKEIAMIPH